jgi:hypothetical protein
MQEGCYDYCQNEAEGISDAYTYLADTNNSELGSAQPKTFVPILRPDQNGNYVEDPRYAIISIPENKTEKKLRIDKSKRSDKEVKELERKVRDEQTKLIKSLENSRKEQDNQIKSFAEQEQMNKIINADNMYQ